MPSEPPAPSGGPSEDVVHVETDQQLHAVGSLVRHRILRVLREGPATVTQIAARLGIAKGSSNYHVKVLAKAGLISVVDTRKVRGVNELYYGMAGKTIQLPESSPGQPEFLMRHALADVESSPEPEHTDMRLRHVRLSPEDFATAVEKLDALHAELVALNDPRQPAADFFSVLYRPQDTRPEAGAPATEPPSGATEDSPPQGAKPRRTTPRTRRTTTGRGKEEAGS